MTTDMSGRPGPFRRLMNKVATWSEALDYSGIDYINPNRNSGHRSRMRSTAIQGGRVNESRSWM